MSDQQAQREALRLAANVLFLLEPEVKALGCRASGVLEKVREVLEHPEPRIVTTFVNPPIPDRAFDWRAYYEGQEESGDYGYGVTEADAIQSLVASQAHMDGVPEAEAPSWDQAWGHACPKSTGTVLLPLAKACTNCGATADGVQEVPRG